MPWNNLEELKKTDISACDAEKLVDLREVEINRKDSAVQRVESFMEQVKNPYLFKVDKTIVKVSFGNGKCFSELLTDAILAG